VLDEAEVAGFAIRNTQDGLVVETQGRAFGREGADALHLGLRELVDLIEWTSSERERDTPRYERSYDHDEGTLSTVLRSRELVGAGR
jgi:hypothetical protein